MVMANQNTALLKNSKATFKSVYEVLGLKEDPERMAQGLIHQQNYLLAMLIYHNVSVDWNLKIIELSKDAIQILQSEK